MDLNAKVKKLKKKEIANLFDKEKIYELILFILLFIAVLFFNSSYGYREFYEFNLADYGCGLLFFLFILYGSFLLYRWQFIRISFSISILFITIILNSILWLLIKKDIMIVGLIAWALFCVIAVIKKQVKEKADFHFINIISNKKMVHIVIFFYIVINVIMQFVWSLNSPDASGYFISARNLLYNNSLEIHEPMVQYSIGFVRKLFYKSSNTTVRSQYPIGSIFFLAFFMKYASFWRIMFPLAAIIISFELVVLYSKFTKNPVSSWQLFFVLSLSQLLILSTTEISFDFIALSLSLIAINSFYEISHALISKKFIILILCIFSIALIKASVLIFLILVLFFLLMYRYSSEKSFKEQIRNLVLQNKTKFILTSSILGIILIIGFYFAFSGYLQKWSFLYKLIMLFLIMNETLLNFSINIVQIIVIYSPYILCMLFGKYIYEKMPIYHLKQKKQIVLPLSILFVIFIFVWNSSNLYPFDISTRYFILIGLIMWALTDFAQLKKKWKKILVFYIIISDVLFLSHAFVLDQRNMAFAKEVYKYVDKSAIIITNYYSKLFPDRIVYITGEEHVGPDEVVIEDIQKLLSLNYTIYFIPERGWSYNRPIVNNFNLTLIYRFNQPPIIPFPQTIFGLYLIDPAPRELYLVTGSK